MSRPTLEQAERLADLWIKRDKLTKTMERHAHTRLAEIYDDARSEVINEIQKVESQVLP